jgi:hypothetical protein
VQVPGPPGVQVPGPPGVQVPSPPGVQVVSYWPRLQAALSRERVVRCTM